MDVCSPEGGIFCPVYKKCSYFMVCGGEDKNRALSFVCFELN